MINSSNNLVVFSYGNHQVAPIEWQHRISYFHAVARHYVDAWGQTAAKQRTIAEKDTSESIFDL